MILVDRAARVRGANRAGEHLLTAADGLAAERGDGRLRAGTPAVTAVLRRLIAEAAVVSTPGGMAVGEDPATPRGGALALPRAAGRPALVARVAPFARGMAAGAHWLQPLEPADARAAAVLFVLDPAAVHPGAAAAARAGLRAAYGLTPAEATVAVALGQGDGLAAVAAAQRVALATVRTQAQQAYRKTGVRGQAGLARLVERLGMS